MATTNYDRVGKALGHLRQGLKQYIEREMEAGSGKVNAYTLKFKDFGFEET